MTSWNSLNRFKYVSKFERRRFSQVSLILTGTIFLSRLFLLKIQLEDIRNSETELRWQPEEDYSECQRCHSAFSVTWRKHHCRKTCPLLISFWSLLVFLGHCGKVLCKDCTNKTVHSGPHHRPSRVCDVCYTLLVKDSQPYFHSSVPNM